MIRTKLIAVVAAAGVFVLIGCSSNTGGSASVATTAATSAATTEPPSGTSAGGDTSSAATEQSTSEQSATEPSTSEQSTTEATSGGTTTTIGNGALDAQSAAWFDAFCTGLAPLAAVGDVMGSVAGGTDPKEQVTASVSAFNAIADAFTNTANTLKGMPAPTFDHGSEIASKIVTGLAQAGPQVKAAAQTLSQVQVTDEAGVQTAIEAAAQTMSSATADLGAGNYELDPGTQADIRKIPSCAKVGFGGGSGSAPSTS